MTEKEALDFLNDTPYFYNSLGVGITITEKVDGVVVRVKRNNKDGGINVFSEDKMFHFYWDLEGKWGLLKPVLPKA